MLSEILQIKKLIFKSACVCGVCLCMCVCLLVLPVHLIRFSHRKIYIYRPYYEYFLFEMQSRKIPRINEIITEIDCNKIMQMILIRV